MYASNGQCFEILKNGMDKLSARDQQFAASLYAQAQSKGKLSDKQWYWVGVLVDRVQTAGVPDFTKEVVAVGQMKGLIALFETAKQHLKYPAISLQLPDGQPVTLKISGSKSKTPGYVQVSDGGPFGANKWFGRVSPEGAWEKSKLVENDAGLSTSIHALLVGMSRNPAQTAADYGKLTGRCCFCNKKLEDEKSTSVGYGPVCAKNYGLPWGAKVVPFPVKCN